MNRFSRKILDELEGNSKDKIITIFGWAFKKNTNDSRESGMV